MTFVSAGRHPLQWRIGNQAAVPVELTFHLDRRKAGRQRATRHHVFRLDGPIFGIEVHEIAAAHIHGTDGQAHLVGIGVEVIEIDEPLERAAQFARVVVARRLDRAGRLEVRRRHPRFEESGGALDHRTGCLQLIEEAARHIAAPEILHRIDEVQPVRRGYAFPERAQPFDPLFRGIARDQGRIDSADRDAGDPIRLDIGFGERLVDASLIGAQRTPALQDESNTFEWRAPEAHVRSWSTAAAGHSCAGSPIKQLQEFRWPSYCSLRLCGGAATLRSVGPLHKMTARTAPQDTLTRACR